MQNSGEQEELPEKTDMLRSIGKQSGESVESVQEKNGRLWWEGFAEKESFKPGVEEWNPIARYVML